MTLPKNKFIRKNEIDLVLEVIKKHSEHKERDRLLIILAAALGLRVTETVTLKAEAFRELGEGWVYVRSAKKRKGWQPCTRKEAKARKSRGYRNIERKIVGYGINERPEDRLPIPLDIANEVKAYLAKYVKGNSYLFPGKCKGRMSERTAFRLFSEYCVRAGIGHKSFHALRHYRGFTVQAAKGDIDWTRRMLRHSTTTMTQIYTERTPDEVRKLADEIGW